MDLLLLSLLLSAVPLALSNCPSARDCPSVREACPSVREACPSVREACPSVKEACPSVKDHLSAEEDSLSAEEDSLSAEEDSLSAEEDSLSAEEDGLSLPLNLDIFTPQHTYSQDKWGNCQSFMKVLAKWMKWGKYTKCKAINDVILGSGKSAKTDQRAVTDVCSRGGTKTPEGNYRSNVAFNVVRCRCTNPNEYFPDCKYTDERLQGYIVVKCDGNVPVHLVGVRKI